MSGQAGGSAWLQRRCPRRRRPLGGRQQGSRYRHPMNSRPHRLRRRQQRRVIERVLHETDLIGPRPAAARRHGMARHAAIRHANRCVDSKLQGRQVERPGRKAPPLQQQQHRQQLSQPASRPMRVSAQPATKTRPQTRRRRGASGSLVLLVQCAVRFLQGLFNPLCPVNRSLATIPLSGETREARSAGHNRLLRVDMWVGRHPLPMSMPAVRYLRRYDVQVGMSYAPLRRQDIGHATHRRHWTTEHRYFQTILVVEMHVHTRHTQVMVVVESAGQPQRQSARFMVIDIAKHSDAGRLISAGDLSRSSLPGHLSPADCAGHPATGRGRTAADGQVHGQRAVDAASARPTCSRRSGGRSG